MSYNIYTTEGFILRSDPLGEADKQYSILTKDLGLISASAKSVRSEKTKLGWGLQDLSLSGISFIRGKQRWKITSAVCLENMYELFRGNTVKLSAYSRIFKLLEMLVTGEETHIHFFNVVQSGVIFLKETELSKDDVALWESVMVIRILSNLGYCAPKDNYKNIFDDLLWNMDLIDTARTHRISIIKDINRSLKETQLTQ